MAFDKRRLAPLALIAALFAVWLVVAPRLPKDQSVHIVLGNAAPRVTELRLRYAQNGDQDVAREATFQYAEGAAPRIVTHEPRLANGNYRIEIDIEGPKGHASTSRSVMLEGNPVSIDVQGAVP